MIRLRNPGTRALSRSLLRIAPSSGRSLSSSFVGRFSSSSTTMPPHQQQRRSVAASESGRAPVGRTTAKGGFSQTHLPHYPGRFTASVSRFTTSSSKAAASASVAADSQWRPWPLPKVTCNGDYRAEAWLEPHIGGPLYQNQSTLPKLPVPTVSETLQKFLPTALPLAESPQEEDNLLKAVQAFEDQSGHLQERLLHRASTEYANSSWLQHWWNTWGYLDVRDPITINVSYFFHFRDDPHANQGGQVERAAALIQAASTVRHQVATGQWPAEIIGKGPRAKPLDATAYKYMFNACRIPQSNSDIYDIHDPSLHRHILVGRRGRWYSLNVCDASGKPYPLALLEHGLKQIVRRTEETPSDATTTSELGWLTSSHRDDWAAARKVLLESGGPRAAPALEKLESAAFAVCLDDGAPVSKAESAWQFWHGGSRDGRNRWMDKSVQLIVTANGKAGLVGEHSMMDGMPVVALADHLTKVTYGACQDVSTASVNESDLDVQDIFEGVNLSAMAPHVVKAKQDFLDLTGRHALHVQSFQGYGSDFIKKAGYSPDAFVQMAMQLATYRLWGHQAGTYEATQVRPYLHGRTETTRSVSTESAAFVQAMGPCPAHNEHVQDIRRTKLELLRAAVDAHVKFLGAAAQAKGVDRHFLGLSMLAKDGESLPDLYGDPVFVRSKRWRVSTSHLTHPKFDGWGYGEVVADGVGLAYSIHPRHCVFNVTALAKHEWTDALCQHLEDALLELRTILELDQPLPASKL